MHFTRTQRGLHDLYSFNKTKPSFYLPLTALRTDCLIWWDSCCIGVLSILLQSFFLQRRANKSWQKSFCHASRELASILQLWNIRGIFSTSIQSVVFSQVLHSRHFWVLHSEGRYIADIHQCNVQIPGEYRINNRSLLILWIWWKESTYCSDYDSCFPLQGRWWHHGDIRLRLAIISETWRRLPTSLSPPPNSHLATRYQLPNKLLTRPKSFSRKLCVRSS